MRSFGGSVSNAPRELPAWNLDGRSVKCSAMLTAALHSTTGPCMLKMDTPQTLGPAPMFRESSYGLNDIKQSNLQQLQFFAQQQYPPTGSTLSELASVSGVGGCDYHHPEPPWPSGLSDKNAFPAQRGSRREISERSLSTST